ncbi:MAG: hypothetical protein CMO47_07520 [Verrucomicrobiales bacterium]|nr:hypothetical protein [Verrucomicrobiales bacterium]|tara:strand:+ start:12563 stop:13498 length:936 start_codon:yes stop_codon:yes gene_type:complete
MAFCPDDFAPAMKLVVNYAAIGFRPYWETGEFINVGVIAVEAKSRYLAYKLISPQRTKRITACFPELDLAIFRNGIRRLDSELSALAIETNLWADGARQAGTNHPEQRDLFIQEGDIDLFRKLTMPHASPFYYASRGARLTDDAEQCLEELYRRYVEHWNLTPVDHEEKKLTRDLKRLLHSHRLDRLYKEAPWVGTEAYHVGIPLVFTPTGEDIPQKAIKPLNLSRPTPTRIYTHGDEWLAKVRRLKRVKCLPKEFLFVVKMPADKESQRAADEICGGLRQLGVEVVDATDEKAILDFARVEEGPELELKS